MSTATATTQTSSAEPMSLQHKAELINNYALELGVALHYSAAIRTTILVFAQRFFRLNHAVFTYLVLGATVAALQTYFITRNITMRTTTALARVVSSAWNSPAAQRLARKVEFEFFVLILGCGNSFCLIVFWPGWIIIGLVYLLWWVLRSWAG